jgi:hypothetical protein
MQLQRLDADGRQWHRGQRIPSISSLSSNIVRTIVEFEDRVSFKR